MTGQEPDGTLVGARYRLGAILGRGGMAVVHLAHDTVLDRRVAIKLIGDPAGDPELRQRFLREGRLAASLSHPNIVRVFDTGEHAGRPYIVMEHVDGRSLAEAAAGRPLPPEEVAELARQACAGLAHAHAAGIVHRDVKPQNLLLRDDGLLKIGDFGIARGAPGATITTAGTILGTAAYLAPEVVAGEPATQSSDLYALGAVLYELLAGRPPREVTTLADLGDDRPVTPVERLAPGTPGPLAAAVARCLDPDPARRPPSADELAFALEAPRPQAAAGATTVSQRAPTARRRRLAVPAGAPRRAWPLLAGAAALVLVALALATLRDGGPPEPSPLEPVPAAEDPAEGARNLSRWLRENAGSG